MWKIEEDYPENKIMPIFPSFKTIYYCMPHELRLCFVYCSIFPKGYVIDKKKLIQQWVALDMIESKHGTLPLDVTAEKYIDELKDIYFLQVLERHQVSLQLYLRYFLFFLTRTIVTLISINSSKYISAKEGSYNNVLL